MRTERSGENEDRLHEVLQTWKVATPLPPGFQEAVWRRIAREETARESTWSRLMAEFAAWCRSLLMQPAGASAYLLALLVTGVGLGYWHSANYTTRTETAWRTAYVHSVNPTAITFER